MTPNHKPPPGLIHEKEFLEWVMRRALTLASLGPTPDPNPQVGCVIINAAGAVVAEGYHQGAGTPHAEIHALSNLSERWRVHAQELTAVVTLEPCAHTGHTGPCAQAIIDAGIGAVVYALSDPTPTAGGGAQLLLEAGLAVRGGILADQTRDLLGPWLAARHLPRPRVTVKWAQSLDGRAAAADGSSQWVTGEQARADAHRRRQAADAIAVGTGTLIADDPALTARDEDGRLLPQQPVPVVWGTRPTPQGAQVNNHPALKNWGLAAPLRYPGTDLRAELADLRARGVRSLFVEGGPTLISALIVAGLVDEVLVYLAPVLLGGPVLALGDLGISTITEHHRLAITNYEFMGQDLALRATTTWKDETCLPD